MKKNGIIWGMLALGLVLGLMVTGCDDGLGGGTSTGDGATVTSVTVSPSPASVAKGANQTFSATVQGTNSPAQTVNWTVSGGGTGTSITTGGVLTVATSESATSLTVEATSTVDTAKSGTAAVTVTSSSGGGTLTVLNYPSSAYVFICTENDPPSSVTELAGRLTSAIAVCTYSSSPFSLDFNRTGNFSVFLQDSSACYFKGNVSFTNGSATIDYTSMTKVENLLPY